MRLIFILLMLILVIIPSCRSQLSGSVIASSCYSHPTSFYINDNFTINTVTTSCNDYKFDPKKLHDILDYFVIEYSSEFDLQDPSFMINANRNSSIEVMLPRRTR